MTARSAAPAASTALDELAVGFTAALRHAGITVPVRATVNFVEALAVVGLADRRAVYWAGRSTLVCRHLDAAVYDRVFDEYWERVLASPDDRSSSTPTLAPPAVLVDDDEHEEAEDPDESADEVAALARSSAIEVLRTRNFADCTDEELAALHRAMRTVAFAGPRRRSARRRPTHRRRARGLDVRRTMRAALADGGEVVRPRYTAPTTRPRRVVLLCDVSGSMEPYAHALVRFLHASVAGRRSTEAFAFGTRLTRLTRELAERDPDVALAAASAAVTDWAGGTRLGEGLRAFNRGWGARGLARGAVVVVLSDGWDRGDPELVGAEMARLHRLAHRIVWVNPLKATEGYEPLARGMAAALPYVDEFVDGHDLASLDALLHLLDELDGRDGSLGRTAGAPAR